MEELVLPNVLIRKIYEQLRRRKAYRWLYRWLRRRKRKVYRWFREILPFKLKFYTKYIAHGFRAKTILTFPEEPDSKAVLYKICHLLGYRITRNTNKNVDLIINWEDTTYRCDYAVLNELNKSQQVLNLGCKDISKKRVDQVHQAVFGYSLAVDPLTHTGPCVKKSNNNCAHDGVILQCPVTETDEQAVYQIVVNNLVSDGYVQDIRVPIFGEKKIRFCYKKYRRLQDRFSNENTFVELCEVDTVLSAEENELLLHFCRCMGLDYGELDVLRDVDTRKLYVVDVNNTPSGPPNHLDDESVQRALRSLSEEFVSSFVAPDKVMTTTP